MPPHLCKGFLVVGVIGIGGVGFLVMGEDIEQGLAMYPCLAKNFPPSICLNSQELGCSHELQACLD